MTLWKEEYDQINKRASSGNGQVTDISSTLTTAIDQIPQMTERKKKIEMHVQIASKILGEIKRRGLDELQEYEDDIMGGSGKIGSANKAKALEYIKRETDKVEEFTDKMRLLLIEVMCGSDLNEIRTMIDNVKMLHADKFDEDFVE